MTNWTKVVIHPLGLCGYALALVFGLLAKSGYVERSPWLMPVAVTMAILALLGGLALAFWQSSHERQSKAHRPSDPSAPAGQVTQHTKGAQSPAIADTKGNVNVSYGDSPKKKP